MAAKRIIKVAMAARMETSRTQVDRLLDPDNLKIQFDSLDKAATAIGIHVEIRLVYDIAS